MTVLALARTQRIEFDPFSFVAAALGDGGAVAVSASIVGVAAIGVRDGPGALVAGDKHGSCGQSGRRLSHAAVSVQNALLVNPMERESAAIAPLCAAFLAVARIRYDRVIKLQSRVLLAIAIQTHVTSNEFVGVSGPCLSCYLGTQAMTTNTACFLSTVFVVDHIDGSAH